MEPAICERIISQISDALDSTTTLGDFDIIDAAGDENKSPVILVENNLALASWCVKHVYSYAFRQTLLSKQKIWKYEECISICKLTQFCLLVCPEINTFWSIRRKLYKKGLISCDKELRLTKLILSRKPKCMEAFFQRQWVLGKSLPVDEAIHRTRVMEERNVCYVTSERHANNYHSWNHRLWLLKQNTSKEYLKLEFDDMKTWCERHVSEHSGLHYFNKLLESILNCYMSNGLSLTESPLSVFSPTEAYLQSLKENKLIINKYCAHEALLYARKYLVLSFSNLLMQHEPIVEENIAGEINNTDNSDNEESDDTPNHKGKKKELRGRSSSIQASKRSCIENINGTWALFLAEEKQYIENKLQEEESTYEGKLLRDYYRFLSQLTL